MEGAAGISTLVNGFPERRQGIELGEDPMVKASTMRGMMGWFLLGTCGAIAQAQIPLGKSRFASYVPFIEQSIALSDESNVPLQSNDVSFIDATEGDFEGEWKLFLEVDAKSEISIFDQTHWSSPGGGNFSPLLDSKYHFHDLAFGHLDYAVFTEATVTEGMCLIFDDPIVSGQRTMICRWLDYPAYAPLPVVQRHTIRLFHRISEVSS